MCSPFSCGSFKSWKEYDFDEPPLSPVKAPKKSKSWRSYSSFRRSGKAADSKNPYANQGLDKFSALMAELDAKKKKIYTQKGSEDISLLYFTYTKSDELRPFVVKVKKQQQYPKNIIPNKAVKEVVKKPVPAVTNNHKDSVQAPPTHLQKRKGPTHIRKTHWSFKLKNDIERRILSYFPLTVILILVLLAFGGRSFAVICVTVAWYLVPMLSREKTPPAQKTNDRK